MGLNEFKGMYSIINKLTKSEIILFEVITHEIHIFTKFPDGNILLQVFSINTFPYFSHELDSALSGIYL